ncbi:MAG TPA: DUF5996 family protein [Nitrososphaeraceae archaeon]|jgi:hypothetical protein|nr:DUF5996 family protein [Nitrososphaeraceae archaeon]
MTPNSWPALPLEEWKDTYATLHRWTQIVGKIRLALTPHRNHWWNTTLYVTPRGLTTSSMPYNDKLLQIDFDFIDHLLLIQTSDGSIQKIFLKSYPVAEFYKETMAALASLGMPVTIWPIPVEVPDRTPFDKDFKHMAYDPKYAHRVWRIISHASRVLAEFSSQFIGKVSPVHFFWGAFDLAVTRFSGRIAPLHPGAPYMAHFVAVEAYSHEVSSCGFWPGGDPIDEPVFYAYAYPEPPGFKDYPIQPPEAFYHTGMREFILPYNIVRTSDSPDKVLLSFLKSTYEAEAISANWDRSTLERQ